MYGTLHKQQVIVLELEDTDELNCFCGDDLGYHYDASNSVPTVIITLLLHQFSSNT